MSQQFNFVLKKLVLVDSAGFCYSEIELDKHTILLGEGNVGKSSLLNCIRLFLLPEVNFNKAKDKFNFKSSNGYEYDKNESFGHYFPSKYSHLIIEVEKVIGGKKYTHCQILNRGKNLSFERIFTTLAYSDIQHLFWQVEDDDEHHIGSRVDKLSTQDIFAKIKGKDKHCISVRDPQKLKDLMYARDILSDVAMRYSLFPLNEATEENIESLRALILMLFDMETSNAGVAKAVANIVEAEKKETTDALNFDIQSFISTHDMLKQEEQKLIDIENKTDEFSKLVKNFTRYSELSEIESRFVNFYLYLNGAIDDTNKAVNLIADTVKSINLELSPIAEQVKNNNQNLFAAKKLIKDIDKKIYQVQTGISKGETELSYYGDNTLEEVMEILEEDISKVGEKIQAINDVDARRVRIEKLQYQIEQNELKAKQLSQQIENFQFSIKQQLPSETLTFLNSINNQLLFANPGREVSEDERIAIDNFQKLFIDQGYSYNFWGQQFNKSTTHVARDLQKELDNISSEILADKTEKKTLENLGSESSLITEKKLQDHTKELNESKRIKGFISQLEERRVTLKVYYSQKNEAQSQIDNLSPTTDKLIEQQSDLAKQLDSEKLKQGSLSKEQTRLLELRNYANGTKQAYSKIQRQLEKQSTFSDSSELTSEYLSSLQNGLQQVEVLRLEIIDSIREFARAEFIDVDTELFKSSPIPSVIHQSYLNLTQVYDELEGQRLLLKTKTKSHNESVSNYVDILDKNFEHINRFENQLNRSFKGISVNDLIEIEVSIHIDDRFKNLIAEIHKSYNEFSEQALSEQFYLRLQAFSDAFFKNGERNKLVMSDVIKMVSYRVKKEGHESWQTKQQSTSTTALINLKLVRILLAKLRADSCLVKLPVIMDEAANINVNQYEWLLRDIKDSGFFLFTAGTHSSGAELVHMIGHHYDVDALKTAKPYTTERTRVVWDGPQAFYDEEEFDSYVSDDQIELLEGVDETI